MKWFTRQKVAIIGAVVALLAIMVAILITVSTGKNKPKNAEQKPKISSMKKSVEKEESSISSSSSSVQSEPASTSSEEAPPVEPAPAEPEPAPAAKVMDVEQIKNGDFSSIAGTWFNAENSTSLTITQNSILVSNSMVSISIGSDFTMTCATDARFNNNHTFKPDPNLYSKGGYAFRGYASNGTSSQGVLMGFYPVGCLYPFNVYDGKSAYLPSDASREMILFWVGQNTPDARVDLYYRQ